MSGSQGAALLLLLLAACGGEAVTPPPATSSLCARETRADVYAAGLAKETSALSVTLLGSEPGPPIKGTNTWTLEVRDASHAKVDGATLKVVPYMPDHGHGTSVKPVVSALGNGQYKVESLYLFMPGLWQVAIDATMPVSGAMSSVVFNFCVDG